MVVVVGEDHRVTAWNHHPPAVKLCIHIQPLAVQLDAHLLRSQLLERHHMFSFRPLLLKLLPVEHRLLCCPRIGLLLFLEQLDLGPLPSALQIAHTDAVPGVIEDVEREQSGASGNGIFDVHPGRRNVLCMLDEHCKHDNRPDQRAHQPEIGFRAQIIHNCTFPCLHPFSQGAYRAPCQLKQAPASKQEDDDFGETIRSAIQDGNMMHTLGYCAHRQVQEIGDGKQGRQREQDNAHGAERKDRNQTDPKCVRVQETSGLKVHGYQLLSVWRNDWNDGDEMLLRWIEHSQGDGGRYAGRRARLRSHAHLHHQIRTGLLVCFQVCRGVAI